MHRPRTFVGFGFGAIQGGLFLYEAFRSGNFGRLVVAEVLPEAVRDLRAAGGAYQVNVATPAGVTRRQVSGVEVFNPRVADDRDRLTAAVAEADEIATALPSVACYDDGGAAAPSVILAAGLRQRAAAGDQRRSIIYTAENHNHAAEIMAQRLDAAGLPGAAAGRAPVQCLNTVIGKMSGVVVEAERLARQQLAPLTPGAGRGLLVEEFNRILISRVAWPDFQRGIAVFEEKDNLLPFEEAKLYGHNATHALLGFLARERGLQSMAEIRSHPDLLNLARGAFLEESGRALCARHAGVDPLFTPAGYQAYADDLLTRMLNPHLGDSVARVVRDPRRKLGWDDRLVGVMRLALGQGIRPWRFARGARAALQLLAAESGAAPPALLDAIWAAAAPAAEEQAAVRRLILAD